MASILTAQEEKTVESFLNIVNEVRRDHNVGPMSFNTGVKFLMARKFDLYRALALYEQHEMTRFREGLANFDPNEEPLKQELLSGKFTVLSSRDPNQCAIAMFTANKHNPMESRRQTTLQGLVVQMDVALESLETQRAGVVFVYNMSDCKYSNFDYELSQKILSLLKGSYPARLKKVLIVCAPMWFKAPFKILRLFVREKLRDRVFMVNLSQLTSHIPASSLPAELGGELKFNHAEWIAHCISHKDAVMGELCDLASCRSSPRSILIAVQQQLALHAGRDHLNRLTGNTTGGVDPALIAGQMPYKNGHLFTDSQNGASDDDSATSSTGFPSSENVYPHQTNGSSTTATTTNLVKSSATTTSATGTPSHKHKPEMIKMPSNNITEGINGTNGGAQLPPPPASLLNDSSPNSHPPKPITPSFPINSPESLHLDDGGMNLEEFIQYLKSKGRKGLYEEYSDIRLRPQEGSFDMARHRDNICKNRYSDVLCLDHSRVLLKVQHDDPSSDFINGNFVDGYKQKNAFISTQGPLPKTFDDFWRMVWEQEVRVVVMTTRTVERARTKCGQYWPLEENDAVQHGAFHLVNNQVEQSKDLTLSSLSLTHTETGLTRQISHMQFISWPDYGVPQSALAMLDFRDRVREHQVKAVTSMGTEWAGHANGPPIVVHCSAGIGRTGTFITLDISILRLEDCGKIDIKTTVEKIRSQRAFSIQMPDQYVFCYLALLEYALSRGLLEDVDLSGFEEDSESEEFDA